MRTSAQAAALAIPPFPGTCKLQPCCKARRSVQTESLRSLHTMVTDSVCDFVQVACFSTSGGASLLPGLLRTARPAQALRSLVLRLACAACTHGGLDGHLQRPCNEAVNLIEVLLLCAGSETGTKWHPKSLSSVTIKTVDVCNVTRHIARACRHNQDGGPLQRAPVIRVSFETTESQRRRGPTAAA